MNSQKFKIQKAKYKKKLVYSAYFEFCLLNFY